jgi:hypothetical protein
MYRKLKLFLPLHEVILIQPTPDLYGIGEVGELRAIDNWGFF